MARNQPAGWHRKKDSGARLERMRGPVLLLRHSDALWPPHPKICCQTQFTIEHLTPWSMGGGNGDNEAPAFAAIIGAAVERRQNS